MPVEALASSDRPVLALDNGSGWIKCGIAGEESPRTMLATSGLDGAGDTRPLKNGVIQDWDVMETYWDHVFTTGMGVNTERCSVVVTCNLFETKDNRERLLQSLFESFAVPAAFCSAPCVFELYADGRENGVVVGCGSQCSYAVLVHEGLPDPRTQLRSTVAGEALDSWTAKTVQAAAGCSLEPAVACRLKEDLGFVRKTADTAIEGEKQFTLPDGRTLQLSAEQRAAIAEPLFNPMLIDEAAGGISQMVADCIRLRDRDGVLESKTIGRDGTSAWFSNVVVAGGTSCFDGFDSRLQHDLALRAPGGTDVRVTAPAERKHAAWLGASILGSLSVMQQMWITKEEYDETGPLIVHRKCF